jgi:DNA-binding response OmpR family regulator
VNKKQILLAQADQAARDRIKDLLPNAEYEIMEANNGAEAFALFRQRPVDLIILDCDLAFIPGCELAALVRRQTPRQSILMLSSATRNFSTELPVDVLLHKACNDKRLLQEINGLIAPDAATLEADDWDSTSQPNPGEPIPA